MIKTERLTLRYSCRRAVASYKERPNSGPYQTPVSESIRFGSEIRADIYGSPRTNFDTMQSNRRETSKINSKPLHLQFILCVPCKMAAIAAVFFCTAPSLASPKERSWLGPSNFVLNSPAPRAGARMASVFNTLFMFGGIEADGEIAIAVQILNV